MRLSKRGKWARFPIALFLMTCAALPARAQFVDDFSDGDFSATPAWTPNDPLWTVVPFESDFALRTDGESVSDTLWISTPSSLAYGTWQFTFAFEGGQLTNFNQVRIFLAADQADLDQPVFGYHLQLGTNSRTVRLYRSDPGASGDRTLLASTADDVISAAGDTLQFVVQRSPENVWTVAMDGNQLLTHAESGSVIGGSSFFGLWVKHSATRATGYYFDDFDVSGTLPPDETPPTVVAGRYDPQQNTMRIDFSETLDPASVDVTDFSVSGGIGSPAGVTVISENGLPPESTVELSFAETVPSGAYDVSVSGVTDPAGNAIVPVSVAVDVESDTTPPELSGVVVENASTLRVEFSEALDAQGGCAVASNYSVSGDIGAPGSATCPGATAMDVTLSFDPAIPAGAYTLTVSNVSDLSGNVLASDSAPFSIDFVGDTPLRGDVVVNEIHYAPTDTDLEFVELYNRSEKTFDLSQFTIADNRFQPVQIVPAPFLLPPASYAVIARDTDALSSVYSGFTAAETSSWPALNNTGDAMVLEYDGVVIDSLQFDPSWGGSGVSLERRDPAGPSTSASNWGSTIDGAGATPGRENSIFGPDVSPPQLIFAEEVADRTIRAYFNEPLDPASVAAANFQFRDAPVVAVLLDSPEATTVEITVADDLTAGPLDVATVSDLTGNLLTSAKVELALKPGPGDIVINEILFDPRADDTDGLPDQPEFIELANVSSRLLTLSGLYWTDVPGEDMVADTVRFGSQPGSQPAGIVPDGFAVVFAQPDDIAPEDVYSGSALVFAYPRDYRADDVALLPVRASTLGLLNDGDVINLQTPAGLQLDSLRYTPTWHNSNVRDATGVSLERIDPLGRSTNRANWTSNVASTGASPGMRNSVYLSPEVENLEPGLQMDPSPFSPDGDGFDDVVAIGYALESSPSLIRARIYDSRGRHVRTLEESQLSTDRGNLLWDGLDDDGNNLRVGIYVILLEAIDAFGGRAEAHKGVVVLARTLD